MTTNITQDVSALIANISVPELESTPASLPLQKEDLEKWISALPMANIGATGKTLYKALHEMNRSVVLSADRLRATDQLSFTVNYLCRNLKRNLLDASFPLTIKNRSISLLCQKLEEEIAISYKIIIIECNVEDPNRTTRSCLSTALNRAVGHSCAVIAYSFLGYMDAPKNAWLELNTLIAVANRYGMTEDKVAPCSSEERLEVATVGTLYKSVLLLSLAQPNSLRQRQLQELTELISLSAEKVDLINRANSKETSVRFYIDLGKDSHPLRVGELNVEFNALNIGIDINEFVQALLDASRQVETDSYPSIIQSALRSWRSSRPQREDRNSYTGEFHIISGLKNIHDVLSDRADNPKIGPAVFSIDETDTFSNTSQIMDPEILHNGHYVDDALEFESEEVIVSAESHFISCEAIDYGGGGYCFQCNDQKDLQSTVGSIVGISNPDDIACLDIGVIRWIQQRNNNVTAFGVETIGCRAQSVHLYTSDQPELCRPCLQLPEDTERGQQPSLICPVEGFLSGDTFVVDNNKTAVEVKLIRLIAHAQSMCQFEYEELQASETTDIADNVSEEENIEDMWSII